MPPPGTHARDDAVAAIAADLFDAVVEPAFWPPALSQLAAELGCQRVLLVRAEAARRVILATSDLDPGAVRRMAGRRLDDREARLIVPPVEHREVPLRPDASGLRLLLDRIEIDAPGEELLARVGPLIARAWRLTDALAASQRHQAWTVSLLERQATGILVLDPGSRVLQANESARRLLAEQGEVSVARGAARATSAPLQRSLAELLARATRFDKRGVATETLLLPRSDDRGPLEFLVVASPRFADSNPEAVAVALVFDPRVEAENPAAVLARRFRLSYEETQVVSLLLHGRDIAAIAAVLDAPPSAVEVCLRNLYEQIGTTRQVELVKLLLSRGGASA
jgi:DNA-binding CsgD family transcriptional regulator